MRPSIINIISGQQVNPLFGMLGSCIKAEGSEEGLGIGKVNTIQVIGEGGTLAERL